MYHIKYSAPSIWLSVISEYLIKLYNHFTKEHLFDVSNFRHISGFEKLRDDIIGIDDKVNNIDYLDKIFKSNFNPEYITNCFLSTFDAWSRAGDGPSLMLLGVYAIRHFGLGEDCFKKPLLVACMLGDIPNSLPYHNNLHYKKVFLNAMAIIRSENFNSDVKLTSHDITLLLVAAAIHDFDHSGEGENTIDGKHQRALNEIHSFDMAVPFLKSVGYDDSETLGVLRAMLCATDVSSSSYFPSYSNIMRKIFKVYYEGGEVPVVPNDLSALKDERLILLAAMLHEADLATSFGFDYELSKAEGCLLAEETGIARIAQPEGLLNFLDIICEGRMLTVGAKALYNNNFEVIRRCALADVRGLPM